MKVKVAEIIEQSYPGGENCLIIGDNCDTKCGECGAGRIKQLILTWLNAHANPGQVKQFLEDWETESLSGGG